MLRSILSGAVLLLVGLVPAAHAQYKIIGADGRVTYTDQPPTGNVKSVEQRSFGGSNAAEVGLPPELEQVMRRYPVTLYSTEKCEPCNSARTFLRARGVPFTERTVRSDEDIIVFRRISPEGTIPVVTIGTGKQLGFEAGALGAALTAAGYPTESRLPEGYKPAGPESVVTPISAAPEAAPPLPPLPRELPPPAEGPPGFRF